MEGGYNGGRSRWRVTAGIEQAKLLIPLALYLLLSALYLLTVPVGESPDEPGHLQCIEQVSQHGRLPQVSPRPTGEWWSRTSIVSGRMCYHMPLYYVAGGFLQRVWHELSDAPLHFEFPPNNPAWGRSPAMFLHVPPWRLAEPAVVTIVRLFTMVLGMIVIWGTHRIATILFPKQGAVALTAAILVAGWPQFLYMSRAINNGFLATTLSVLVLVTLLASRRPVRYVWAAILATLALLSKLTAVFTLGVVTTLFIVELWHALHTRRTQEWKALLRAGLAMVVVFCGLFAVIALVPSLRYNFAQSVGEFRAVPSQATTIAYWAEVLQLTASSGWARFGWMNVATPNWQNYGWWLFILLGAIGGVLNLATNREEVSRWEWALVGVWVLGVTASYFRINLNRFQPQFRFAFTLLPVLAVLAAAGYLHWFRSKAYLVPALLVPGLLLINLGLIFGLIVPTYYP